MIRVEASHVFPVSPEAGFDYITDIRNWPEYWPGLVGIEAWPHARWEKPGDEVALEMRLAGRDVRLRMRLEELRRPELVIYRSQQRGLPDARHERHFQRAPGGFTYRLEVAYRPRRGVLAILDRTVVRRGIRKALDQTIRNLEDRLGVVRGFGVFDGEAHERGRSETAGPA